MYHNKLIIKVCGMRDPDNICQLDKAGIVDWMGLIFYKKSVRYVSSVPSFLPERMKNIGVFVNPDIEDVTARVLPFNLKGIQLHGHETPDFIRHLKLQLEQNMDNMCNGTLNMFRSAFNSLPDCFCGDTSQDDNETIRRPKEIIVKTKEIPFVIKAFGIQSAEDLRKQDAYEGLCDYYLFDTKCITKGGSGKQFDWSLLEKYKGKTPFLLSGGIGPDSLSALNTFDHPMWAGIDLNSCFETGPALKDISLLTHFCTTLKKQYHE